MIAVIAAHRDGKKIECRGIGGHEWGRAMEPPLWNFSDYEYRIAPEPPKPREFRICVNKGCKGGQYYIRPEISSDPSMEWITVQEVLDESEADSVRAP